MSYGQSAQGHSYQRPGPPVTVSSNSYYQSAQGNPQEREVYFKSNLFKVTAPDLFEYTISLTPKVELRGEPAHQLSKKIQETARTWYNTVELCGGLKKLVSREYVVEPVAFDIEFEAVTYNILVTFTCKVSHQDDFLRSFVDSIVTNAQMPQMPTARSKFLLLMNPYQEVIHHTSPFSMLTCFSWGLVKIEQMSFVRVTPVPMFAHHGSILELIGALKEKGYSEDQIKGIIKRRFVLRPKYPPFNKYYRVDDVDFRTNALTFEVESKTKQIGSEPQKVTLREKLCNKLSVDSSEAITVTEFQPLLVASEVDLRQKEASVRSVCHLVPELYEPVFDCRSLSLFGLQEEGEKYTGLMYSQYMIASFFNKVFISQFAQTAFKSWGVTISSTTESFRVKPFPDLHFHCGGGPPVVKRCFDPLSTERLRLDICSQRMFNSPANTVEWAIICSADTVDVCKILLSQCSKLLDVHRYPFSKPRTFSVREDTVASWEEGLNNRLTTHSLRFVLVVLNKGTGAFSNLAQAIESFMIHTIKKPYQMILAEEIQKASASREILPMCHQVLHRFNLSMDYCPWRTDEMPFIDLPCIVIGLKIKWLENANCYASTLVCSHNKYFSNYWNMVCLFRRDELPTLGKRMHSQISHMAKTFAESKKSPSVQGMFMFYEKHVKEGFEGEGEIIRKQIDELKRLTPFDRFYSFEYAKKKDWVFGSTTARNTFFPYFDNAMNFPSFKEKMLGSFAPFWHPCIYKRVLPQKKKMVVIVPLEYQNPEKAPLTLKYSITGPSIDSRAREIETFIQKIHCLDYFHIGFSKYPAPLRFAKNLGKILSLASLKEKSREELINTVRFINVDYPKFAINVRSLSD